MRERKDSTALDTSAQEPQSDSADALVNHPGAQALAYAAIKIFAQASFSITTRADPDEGWERTVLMVNTGIEDLDRRMDCEDKFYAILDSDDALRVALHSVVVSFS